MSTDNFEVSGGLLRYDSSIDKKVAPAVASVLKTDVLKVKKNQQGEVNHVYYVETNQYPAVVKVFRYKYWPEKYKLKTINQQLANYKIPHAKQLYYSRSSKYFPFGFEITQYLEGQNCEDLLANKHLSYFEFYSQVAKLLSQVHKITLPKFGSVNSKGKEVLDSYQKYIDYRINLVIKQTSALPKLDRVLINKAKKQIFLWLETIPFTQPVLIHGDPTPKNCLLDLSQNLVLIDWDDAKADIWLADFAWLTYFGTYSAGTISPKRQKIIRDAFTNNYGDYNFHSPEIVHFENALHLLISLELLPYYYFDQQNKDAYHWVKNKIVDILSLNRKM